MAQQAEPLTLLARALDQVDGLIAATNPQQAELPTPCRSWTVRRLVHHLVTDLDNFAAAVRGEKPDWSKPGGPIGDVCAEAFATARRGLDQAWNSADVDSMVPTPSGAEAPLVSRADQQIAELAVHAWDLERATGQSETLDPEVAAYGLHWGLQNLVPRFRGPEDEGKAFGTEVAVPNDAPVYERLAGWFGRDPQWSSTAG